MKGMIIVCFSMLVALNSYGQDVIKGLGPTGTPVEYHLLRSTVTTKDGYKSAVVKKVFLDDNSSRMLHLKVDCKAQTYIITQTVAEGTVIEGISEGAGFINKETEMNPVTAGSAMEKVINAICTE